MSWFGKERAAHKRPLKVNVFEQMIAHQGMLEQIPIFPYFGPGDIVPTAALSFSRSFATTSTETLCFD